MQAGLQNQPCRVQLLGAVLACVVQRQDSTLPTWRCPFNSGHRLWRGPPAGIGSTLLRCRVLGAPRVRISLSPHAVGAGRTGGCKPLAFGHARFDPWTRHGGFGTWHAKRSRKAWRVIPWSVRLRHPPRRLRSTSGQGHPVLSRTAAVRIRSGVRCRRLAVEDPRPSISRTPVRIRSALRTWGSAGQLPRKAQDKPGPALASHANHRALLRWGNR